MEQTLRFSDLYMPMLARLSDDDKLDIISKLVVTIRSKSKAEKAKRPDISTLFSGDWENDVPADELADRYRASRYYDADKKIEW